MYNMVADFKNRGVPIDGVGLQMHLSSGGIDYNSLAQNMQRFANLGLEVYITEMDVGISSTSQANLQAQANVYSNVLARCKAQPACKGLQVWGIPDKYSWRTNAWPLLFDDNYNAKPAYYSIQPGWAAEYPNAHANAPTPVGKQLHRARLLTNGRRGGTAGWSVFTAARWLTRARPWRCRSLLIRPHVGMEQYRPKRNIQIDQWQRPTPATFG
jgi:hypothetical protein